MSARAVRSPVARPLAGGGNMARPSAWGMAQQQVALTVKARDLLQRHAPSARARHVPSARKRPSDRRSDRPGAHAAS